MIRIITLCLPLLLSASQLCAQSIFYDQGSLISELNVDEEADAYPWLSADGLRLYYSKNYENFVSHIGYAVRENIDAPFVLMDTYLAGATTDGSSCWLMPDELTIYFTASGSLRKATRAAIGDQFGPYVTVSLTGANVSGARGPALTPDGSQLIIRDSGINAYRKFINTGPDTFTSDGTINPGLTGQGPGKLDHTGLAYYFSADGNDGHTVFRMSRTSLTEEFTNIQQLNGAIFSNPFRWIQASVAADESVMVLVRNLNDLWVNNDLFRTKGTNMVGMQDLWQDISNIWPNPATDQINMLLPESVGGGNIELVIMDISGRQVYIGITQANGIVQQDVSGLPAGTYILLIHGNGQSHRTKFMIAR